ncbi:FkbM family methyltransferase [Lysobacter sp. GCM10012299]|uniref:FkbM family methyltransferase n=1 Tax=Lysobacter sp. GCM10012299 TaxID=3317333 RepID=UPI0036220072
MELARTLIRIEETAMSDFEGMLEATYRRFLQPGDVCVDVGAHAGRHTIPLMECCGPSGRVLAFEPLPALAAHLRERINNDSRSARVELHQCALADSTGQAEFVMVVESPGYSGLRERTYDQVVTTERLTVAVRRLDEFTDELGDLRFIKIDCEGGELGVLRGGREVITRYRPIVSFECGDASLINYDHTSADIFDFFASLDYRIVSITGIELDRDGFVLASAKQEYWDYLAHPAYASL